MLGLLWVDVAGSTRLINKLGQGEAAYAHERALKRVERAVQSYLGTWVHESGSARCALFQQADEGCLAALEMQRRVQELPPVSGVQLGIRVGFLALPDPDIESTFTGAAVSQDDLQRGELLLNVAGVGQVVVSATTAASLAPNLRTYLRSLDGVYVPGVVGDEAVYALDWAAVQQKVFGAESDAGGMETPPPLPEAPVALAQIVPAQPSARVSRCMLRFNGKALLIDGRSPKVRVGRSKDSDLLLLNRHVSRQHATIEFGNDAFWLTDSSTNGTFVRVEGRLERLVHGEGAVLEGSGVLIFGRTQGQEGDVVEYALE